MTPVCQAPGGIKDRLSCFRWGLVKINDQVRNETRTTTNEVCCRCLPHLDHEVAVINGGVVMLASITKALHITDDKASAVQCRADFRPGVEVKCCRPTICHYLDHKPFQSHWPMQR